MFFFFLSSMYMYVSFLTVKFNPFMHYFKIFLFYVCSNDSFNVAFTINQFLNLLLLSLLLLFLLLL